MSAAPRIDLGCPPAHAEIEGVRTAWFRRGAGPAVVFLHGGAPGACSELNWFRNFGSLADAGYEAIAFDQPGFGRSATPEDASIEFRYRHAGSFLRFLGDRPLYLVGNSIGGLLATLLVLRLAGEGVKIRGLVVAAPFPYFPVAGRTQAEQAAHRARLSGVEQSFESVLALCRRTFYDPSFASETLVRFRLSMLQDGNWRAFQARNQAGNAFDTAALEERTVDTPALVVWGIQDRSVPVEVGIEAMKRYVNAQFLFLPQCAHWPQTEQANAFNRALAGFLQEREHDEARQKGD